MILAGTGHRPSKLWPMDPYNPDNLVKLTQGLVKYIRALPADQTPTLVLSGMALGFDQCLAKAALELGIPFEAVVPCQQQDKFWPKKAKQEYADLLKLAQDQRLVTLGTYAPWKMALRNQYLVKHSNVLLAMWNGTPGGTANCIQYAKKVNREIWYINPDQIIGV